MDSLATLPYLEELRITLGGGSVSALKLEQLTNLRKINISGFSTDYRTIIIPGLRTLISNSPQLTHLDIDNHSQRAEYDTSTLHDLLGAVAPNSPLNLTNLNLRGLCIKLDAGTIPHLRSLQSISLCNIIDTRQEDLAHLDDLPFREELVERTGAFSSSPQEIWDMFREEHICLTEIITDQVNEGLLQYLASYDGLKSLVLSARTTGNAYASNKLAVEFYNEVLPRHAPTLVCLDILPDHEGKWCFGKHNSVSVLQCGRLATLRMSVNSLEIEREKEDIVVSSSPDQQ